MSPAYSAGISELDEVLVKASRDNSTESETKRSVAVVTRQQLDEQQPDSVAQALKYQPNIEVGGGPRSSNQQPVVRGLSGNQVLQLVDGARQNFNSGHRGAYQIDPELLEQIDVIKGPASSLWGSGAIGGVVSQTTRDARDLLAPEQGFGAYVKQGHATVSDQNKTSGAIYGRLGEQVDLLINGYYSDQNNIRLGNGESLSDSSERTTGGMIKVGWQLDKDQRLTLSQRRHEIDGTVPGNPAKDSTGNPLVERDSSSDHTTLNYQLDPDSEWLDLDATLYYNRTNVDEHRIVEQQRDNIKYRSEGFSVVNRSQLANIDWVYGADGFRDKSQGTREGTARPTPADGRTQVVGSFIKADLPLAENWTLTPGLRYDHFKTEAKNLEDSKRSEDAWSKSLALGWQANDWLELVARYDEAFRAPTGEELYTTGAHFEILPGVINEFVAAPDLKPEKAKNKELLARMNFENLLADNDRLKVNASLFKNDITDYIAQITYGNIVLPGGMVLPIPNKTTYVNVGKAEIKGGEIAASYRVQDLDVGLSYGRMISKDKSNGHPLEGVPADKWVAQAGYWLLDDQLRLGAQATYTSSLQFIGEDQRGTSDAVYEHYTLLDLEARWFGRGAVDGLEVGLAVDNLTDRYYRRAFSELYDPGRNVKLAALYRF